MSNLQSNDQTEQTMSLEGRLEGRLTLPVVVYLADPGKPEAAELVVTENVSARGARVLSKRRFETGAQMHVFPLNNNPRLLAQIVYCHKMSFNSFWVGLQFQENFPDWWKPA